MNTSHSIETEKLLGPMAETAVSRDRATTNGWYATPSHSLGILAHDQSKRRWYEVKKNAHSIGGNTGYNYNPMRWYEMKSTTLVATPVEGNKMTTKRGGMQ